MSVATSSSMNIIPLSTSCVDTPLGDGRLYHSIYVFCDNYVPDSFVYFNDEYNRVMMHDYRNLIKKLRDQFGWTKETNWFYQSTTITHDNKNLYALGFHFSKEEDAVAFKLAYT